MASQGDDHLNQQFPIHNSQKVGEIRNKPDVRAPGTAVSSAPFYENGKTKIFEEADCLNYPSARTREANNTLTRSSNLITVPLQGQSQDSYYLGYNTISGYYPSPYQEYVPPPPSQTDVPVPIQQWASNQQFYG